MTQWPRVASLIGEPDRFLDAGVEDQLVAREDDDCFQNIPAQNCLLPSLVQTFSGGGLATDALALTCYPGLRREVLPLSGLAVLIERLYVLLCGFSAHHSGNLLRKSISHRQPICSSAGRKECDHQPVVHFGSIPVSERSGRPGRRLL